MKHSQRPPRVLLVGTFNNGSHAAIKAQLATHNITCARTFRHTLNAVFIGDKTRRLPTSLPRATDTNVPFFSGDLLRDLLNHGALDQILSKPRQRGHTTLEQLRTLRHTPWELKHLQMLRTLFERCPENQRSVFMDCALPYTDSVLRAQTKILTVNPAFDTNPFTWDPSALPAALRPLVRHARISRPNTQQIRKYEGCTHIHTLEYTKILLSKEAIDFLDTQPHLHTLYLSRCTFKKRNHTRTLQSAPKRLSIGAVKMDKHYISIDQTLHSTGLLRNVHTLAVSGSASPILARVFPQLHTLRLNNTTRKNAFSVFQNTHPPKLRHFALYNCPIDPSILHEMLASSHVRNLSSLSWKGSPFRPKHHTQDPFPNLTFLAFSDDTIAAYSPAQVRDQFLHQDQLLFPALTHLQFSAPQHQPSNHLSALLSGVFPKLQHLTIHAFRKKDTHERTKCIDLLCNSSASNVLTTLDLRATTFNPEHIQTLLTSPRLQNLQTIHTPRSTRTLKKLAKERGVELIV